MNDQNQDDHEIYGAENGESDKEGNTERLSDNIEPLMNQMQGNQEYSNVQMVD